MDGCTIPEELVCTARAVVEKLAQNVETGGSPVYSALLASQLYEALRRELRDTPRSNAPKVGLLAAAIGQCRRAASFGGRPAVMAAELRAALAVLESGRILRLVVSAAPARSSGTRPRLRLIPGGLSRSA